MPPLIFDVASPALGVACVGVLGASNSMAITVVGVAMVMVAAIHALRDVIIAWLQTSQRGRPKP